MYTHIEEFLLKTSHLEIINRLFLLFVSFDQGIEDYKKVDLTLMQFVCKSKTFITQMGEDQFFRAGY